MKGSKDIAMAEGILKGPLNGGFRKCTFVSYM